MPLHELTARTARVPQRNTTPTDATATDATTTTATTAATATTANTTEVAAARTSLKGLDLATLVAAAPPPTSSPSRMDIARLGAVPGAVAAVAAQPSTTPARGASAGTTSTAPAHFEALRASIDGIGDLEARQRAFLRVIETFGSEWTPDATSRVLFSGGAAAVGELKKRGLWEPWEPARGQSRLQLTPDEQTQFIDVVIAPAWQKLVADTAAFASSKSASGNTFDADLAQHVRGLVELDTLWELFAKKLWYTRTDAVKLDDAGVVALASAARPVDQLTVAAAIDKMRPGAAKTLADGAVGPASLDDLAALLLAAEKNGALLPLRTLVGDRLAATHPLSEWKAYVEAPGADDVKTMMTRLHGAALAIDHGKLAAASNETAQQTATSLWLGRVARFDLDEMETAAKVVGLAESLSTSARFGANVVDATLGAMPDATLVKLALLPPSVPPPPPPKSSGSFHPSWSRPSSSAKHVEDPQARIHREAAAFIGKARPDVLVRMLSSPTSSSPTTTTAAQKREHLASALALLSGYEASACSPHKPATAQAAGAVVSSLLSDPTTTDEPRDRKATTPYAPSDTSLQKLLAGARTLAEKCDVPVPIDAAALSPLLASRPSEELVALVEPVSIGDKRAWCGDDAATSVRAELRARFAATKLEPHEALLRAAFADAPAGEPTQAALTSWCGAHRANGAVEHAAALVAVAKAFGPELSKGTSTTSSTDARKAAVEGALLSSFGDLVDDAVAKSQKPGASPLDDKTVRELFALAHAVEGSMPSDFAPKLSTLVANKLPLDAVTAPFLDDKIATALRYALPTASHAAEARIAALEPREASAFFAGAGNDGKELARRVGIALRGWLGAGTYSYVQPASQNAKSIAEQALPAALTKLAQIGDVNDADQRRMVLFAAHALREKLGADVVVDIPAAAAARFADAAPAKDVVALCLDGATGPGLHAAAIETVEKRAQAGQSSVSSLRELLDGFLSLSSGSSSTSSGNAGGNAPSGNAGGNAPSGNAGGNAPNDVAAWRKLVDEQLDKLGDRPWKVLWSAVDTALARAQSNGDIAARARDVLALLPPSRDQNQALSQALGKPPLPFAALTQINSYDVKRNDDVVLRPQRRLLATAIGAHPEGPFAVINALNASALQASALQASAPQASAHASSPISSSPSAAPASSASLPPGLVDAWRQLSDGERRDVVEDSFRKLFRGAYGDTRYNSGAAGDADVRERVDDALEREVFSTLRQDKDLAPLVDRLRPIFTGLPNNVQARVAAAFALDDDKNAKADPPAVLRRLLENAGVVAIKVAQQICEDPQVPKRFRDVLESLRDQNLEVSPLDAWSVAGGGGAVRGAQDAGYGALGKRLGTGSVKQANRVVSTSSASSSRDPLVLAFLKPGVKEEIEQSLRALGVDKELAPIVNRVRSMLMRELDLDKEAEAFGTMAKHLAPWDFMRVPKVIAHDRESLVREMSPGTPVSEILRTRKLESDEKTALQESYRALFAAALDPARFVDSYDMSRGGVAKRGFVLTDPHQGNVALDRVDGKVKVDLFDPGQFETVSAKEANLFVQLIVHLSDSYWAPKRDSLLDEFAQLLYDDAQGSQSQWARSAAGSVDAVRTKLAAAWTSAEKSLGAGKKEPGEFLRAWLFAAADGGLNVPDAYFGVAKMLHTIDSQCKDMGLDDVIKDEVTRLYKGQLTFGKALGRLFRV